MKISVRRKLVIGTAVIAAAAFAGGAYAAENSGTTARQAFLNDVAKRLNVPPKQLSAALQGAFLDQLQAAVAAGKLTQAQADAIKKRVQQSGTAPLGGGRSLGPPGGGWPSARPRFFRSAGPLAAAARYLGLSQTQLADQLGSGKSLAQVARAQGKSVSGLKDAMIAAERSRLAKLVASKVITAAQERQILSNLSSRLDNEINRSGMKRPSGFRPMFRDHASAQRIPPLIGPPSQSGAASAPAAADGPVH